MRCSIKPFGSHSIARSLFMAVVLTWQSLSAPSSLMADEGRFAVGPIRDIEGKLHEPFTDAEVQGIVLVFISTDCPIANSYQPLLSRLEAEHVKHGIQFFMVHPNRQVGIEKARQHADEYDIQCPVLIDGEQHLARKVGAKVTPEVFVYLRGESQPVYHGRIDNRYATYGKKRRTATTHELSDALDAIASDQRPAIRHAEPVGCIISYVKR